MLNKIYILTRPLLDDMYHFYDEELLRNFLDEFEFKFHVKWGLY
jgi:hypothetical protein